MSSSLCRFLQTPVCIVLLATYLASRAVGAAQLGVLIYNHKTLAAATNVSEMNESMEQLSGLTQPPPLVSWLMG